MSEPKRPVEVQVHDDGQERGVEAELSLDVPPEAVWRALTEADELTRWFPFQARVEPGAGGQIWMSWDGAWEGANRIEIWEPAHRLRTGWSVDESVQPGSAERLAVDYHLEAEGGGTRLRLVHNGFGKGARWDELFDGVRRGWGFELRCLRHYLERHRGSGRRVVRVHRPLAATREASAALLLSEKGLLASGSLDRLQEGDRYRLTTTGGESFSGTVFYQELPAEIALVAEEWNDALLRVTFERWDGPEAPVQALLWLESWGVEPARLDALEASWRSTLERLAA